MRGKWTARLSHLKPHYKLFPYMNDYAGPNQERLWARLFGTSRFGTLKLHTLTYEKILQTEPNILPFEKLVYTSFLEHLETSETSTSKVRRMWRTTHWLCNQLGLPSPQSDQGLKSIYETTCNNLIRGVYHEKFRAFPPHMAVILGPFPIPSNEFRSS